MLICPQCQFENPTNNKFCQQCGTSLTHKACPECSTTVAWNQERCDNCDTVTGTIWLAIIRVPDAAVTPTIDQSAPADMATTKPLMLEAGAFLDQQQRYQLLESSPVEFETVTRAEILVKVLDRQPLLGSALLAGAEIPTIAKAYLTLQDELNEAIPAIHDAWHASGEYVLIADRSDWQPLLTLWQDETISPLQILHWLHDMIQLWIALEPWQCQHSLLEVANLRVDEDGVLALQRLYSDDSAVTLQELGNVWSRLFQESQRTQFGALVALLGEMQSGDVQTAEALQSRLDAIASERQNNSFTSTMESDTVINYTQQHESAVDTQTQAENPTLLLPIRLFSIEDVGNTDVGRQREHNEDFFGIETTINRQEFPSDRAIQARGLYILCDGMGGHAGGEVASHLAVKTLQQYFQAHWQSEQLPSESSIREAVQLANQAIYDLNQQEARSGVGRMGTTLVMALIQNNKVAVAHVGDSRLYLLTRRRELEQVTTDHEVGQREILRGVEPEIAYGRPDAYQLTQALGPREANYVNPDVQFLELKEDALIVLTSDGLSDNDLLEHHWHTHLEPLLNSEADLTRGLANLIELANHYNGHDNITAILVRAQVRPKQTDESEPTIPLT